MPTHADGAASRVAGPQGFGAVPPESPELTLVRLRPRDGTLHVSKGRTVLATGRDGFVSEGTDHGLFVHETRLISRYRFLVDGQPFHPVSLSNIGQHSWLGYYIAPASARLRRARGFALAEAAQNPLELRLSRYAGEGLHEDVDLANFTQEPLALTLALEIDGDFADQEEVQGGRRQRGHLSRRWIEREGAWELVLDYRAELPYDDQGETGIGRLRRGVRVRFSNATMPPRHRRALFARHSRILFAVTLEPHARWHCCIDIIPMIEDRDLAPRYGCRSFTRQSNEYDRRTRIFMSEAARFSSAESGTLSDVVVGALEQGKRDLAALRLYDLDTDERAWTTAAGLPTYVALFGRDTLTAAWEAAPVATDLMRGTLPVLASTQGKESNDWRDEQPGRMLHEARTGP